MNRKVWLEVTHIINRHGRSMTGIGYYTDNLVKNLLSLPSDIEFIPFGGLFITSQPPSTYSGPATKLFRLLPGKVWNQLVKRHLFPTVNAIFGVKQDDLVIFFNYVRLPVRGNTKTITTVYDLAFLHFPHYVDEKNRKYLAEFVPKSIKNSDSILTISEHAKSDIVASYQIDPAKVSVIPPAIDHSLFKPLSMEDVNPVLQKYHISKSYILFVGTLEPRKNLECLIDAYESLDGKLKTTYSLVLAGGKGWLDEGLREKLSQTTYLDIIETGYIDEQDKPALYSGASVFVLPSHFEGFGMPVLEAMASGTPVVAANNSSLPEVIGEAGVLFETNKSDDLAHKLTKILTDKAYAKRLTRLGLAQAKQYSWSKSARLMLDLIDNVAGKQSDDRINS